MASKQQQAHKEHELEREAAARRLLDDRAGAVARDEAERVARSEITDSAKQDEVESFSPSDLPSDPATWPSWNVGPTVRAIRITGRFRFDGEDHEDGYLVARPGEPVIAVARGDFEKPGTYYVG